MELAVRFSFYLFFSETWDLNEECYNLWTIISSQMLKSGYHKNHFTNFFSKKAVFKDVQEK